MQDEENRDMGLYAKAEITKEEEIKEMNLCSELGKTDAKKTGDKEKVQFPTEIVRDTDSEMAKEKDINVSSRDTKIRKKKGAAQLAKKWDRNKETKSGGKSDSDDTSVLCKNPEAHLAREEDKSAETQQSEEKNQIKDTDAEMVKEKDINVSSRDTKIRKKKGAAQLAKKWDRNKETKSGGKSDSDDISVLCKNPEAHLAQEEDKSAETQQSEERSRNTEPQSPKESEGYWDSLEEEVMKMYQLDKFGNPIEKKAVDKDRILETQFPSEIVRDTDVEIAKGKDINVSSRDKKKRKKKGAAQLAKKWDANKETGSGGKCGSDISVLGQSPEAHLAWGEDKNAETQQSEEGDQPTKQKQSQLLDNDTPYLPMVVQDIENMTPYKLKGDLSANHLKLKEEGF
ncbi:hypothetical protein TNCT_100081 [Trichonephila clavata]|uniref:Uncharacterized protein n=1 Tax=Trichonephila clavata TaxID=2740835 RepID=A0A8X6M2L8_TRICU|nr:hypothetical protein TNCT_100081 [Trichonephila clavata]